MTMVPAQTLSKHHQLYYYCGGYGNREEEEEEEEEEYNNNYYETAAQAGGLLGGGSDHLGVVAVNSNPMAEDESRTTTTTNYTTSAASLNNNNNNNEAAASSSKDVDDASWLQLSIGGASSAKTNTHADATTRTRDGVGLVELDLLPSRSSEGERVISHEDTRVLPIATPIFHVPPPQMVPSFLFQAAGAAGSSSSTVVPPPPHHHQQHQEFNWPFRPAAVLSSSPTSSNNPLSFMQLGSYFAPAPFQLPGGGGGVGVAGPSLDFRVIDPPRRPHSGIWFLLQASQNQ